jgi:hypothetical protein
MSATAGHGIDETWEMLQRLWHEADLALDVHEAEHPFDRPTMLELDTLHGMQGESERMHSDELATIELELRRLEACRAAVIASAERHGHHLVDGHRGPAAWARASLDISPALSHRLVARARLLAREPQLDHALRTGRVGVDHVDIIAHYATPDYAADNLTPYLPALLNAADTLPYDDFVFAVRYWQLTVDPGAELDTDARAHRNRCFRLRRRTNGSWAISGDLSSTDGVTADEVFLRFLDAETETDWAHARALKGDLATRADLPRSLDQCRADAFIAMIRHAARPDVGQPAEPLVNLLVDADALLDTVGHETERTADPATWTWRNRAAQTTSGHPVHPRHILHAMLVGKTRLIIHDGAGRITHVGRTQRSFSGAVKDMVDALHPRCRHPGCACQRLQLDHIDPWSTGGASDLDNAAPLCGLHNRWQYRTGYRTQREADGSWRTIRPDGTDVGKG